MGYNRAAYPQTYFRSSGTCCSVCVHTGAFEHSAQCDRANGIIPEPDPEPDEHGGSDDSSSRRPPMNPPPGSAGGSRDQIGDSPPSYDSLFGNNLEAHAPGRAPVIGQPPRSNPTARPPLTDVSHQSELPRPPEARQSSDVSGFDHYAQSSNRIADERHVLDLLECWKIAMALLPASSGAKKKPLVTAPFDATAAKQYVSATAFKMGQAPLEQSDLVALS